MDPREIVKASRFLSLVLRHRPEVAGISLDEAGWTSVEDLLEGCARAGRPLAIEDLREIVARNDKRRFEFSPDGTRIRASQGHSVPVDLGYPPVEPPEVLYHGTREAVLARIRIEGLRKGTRHDVHLHPDPEVARRVGARHGSPAVLVVEARRMHADGHVFRVSANGVWLADHVPPGYLIFPDAEKKRP